MADMNAMVADAENYLHVGPDANGKIRMDVDKFGGFQINEGAMNDSFYQVNVKKWTVVLFHVSEITVPISTILNYYKY